MVREILLEVPGAAGHGGAQLRHDVEQGGDIAGRFHGGPGSFGEIVPVCRKTWGDPSQTLLISTLFPGDVKPPP